MASFFHEGLVTNTAWTGAPTAAGVYPGDCVRPARSTVGSAPALPAPAAVNGRTCTNAGGAPSARDVARLQGLVDAATALVAAGATYARSPPRGAARAAARAAVAADWARAARRGRSSAGGVLTSADGGARRPSEAGAAAGRALAAKFLGGGPAAPAGGLLDARPVDAAAYASLKNALSAAFAEAMQQCASPEQASALGQLWSTVAAFCDRSVARVAEAGAHAADADRRAAAAELKLEEVGVSPLPSEDGGVDGAENRGWAAAAPAPTPPPAPRTAAGLTAAEQRALDACAFAAEVGPAARRAAEARAAAAPVCPAPTARDAGVRSSVNALRRSAVVENVPVASPPPAGFADALADAVAVGAAAAAAASPQPRASLEGSPSARQGSSSPPRPPPPPPSPPRRRSLSGASRRPATTTTTPMPTPPCAWRCRPCDPGSGRPEGTLWSPRRGGRRARPRGGRPRGWRRPWRR